MIEFILRFISPAALWGLAAAAPAVVNEYLYRTLPSVGEPGGWLKYLWIWIPTQLTIGYCIYRLVTIPNSTLLDAFAIWAFSTIFMRVFITTALLHDSIKGGTWFALALIIMARIAQAFWGR